MWIFIREETNEIVNKFPGTEQNSSYKATGISVVLHPTSPHIPSMHFNTRFLQTQKEWFGGGIDITPCLLFDNKKNLHYKLLRKYRRCCKYFESLKKG